MRRAVVIVLIGVILVPLVLGGPRLVALLALLVVVVLAVFGRRISRSIPERAPTVLRKAADAAFLGFIVIYAGASLLFLVAGLGPAISQAFPSLHSALHRWGGTTPAVRVEAASLARDGRFQDEAIRFAAGGEIRLRFTNLDGEEHNVSIYEDAEYRQVVFRGALITGPRTIDYEFQLPPPGTYYFLCDPHPDTMHGVVFVDDGPTTAGPVPTSLPAFVAAVARRTAEASHAGEPAMRVILQYLFSVLNVALGVLVIRLRPRARTAQLLSVGLIGTAAIFNLQAHTALTVLPVLEGTAHTSFHVLSGAAYVLAVMLFPDGRLPRWSLPRWIRWPAWGLYVFVFMVTAFLLVGSIHGNPADYVVFFGVVIPIAGISSQVFRYRRAADPQVRQQSRILLWALMLASGAALAVVALPLLVHLLQGSGHTVKDLRDRAFEVFPALFVVIPAVLVAVLVRYRLWDVQKVLNRALVYGTLAAFITAVYVALVVGVSRAVGPGDDVSIVWYLLATAIIAVAFETLRERLQLLANRLVYGRRATPYEVMADFAERMSGALRIEEVLPRMAQAAARGVGADRARVRLFLPDGEVRIVSWPIEAAEGPFDRSIMVKHKDEPVGEIAVGKKPGDPLTPAELALLEDLAAQAGLAMRNVRLALELEARLEEISVQADELRASRQRIVAAQDAERRRLERDIHDGAQQQLVAMQVRLRMVPDLMDRDAEQAAQVLDGLGLAATETLETLRDLARGIFPALLADRGVTAALAAQVRKSELPVTFEIDEDLAGSRFDQDVEAAVYFCCLEALANASKHAGGAPISLSLRRAGGWLEFSVADRGPGFDPAADGKGSGLRNMADRMSALGGSLEVRSAPGAGTRVSGRIPISELEPAE